MWGGLAGNPALVQVQIREFGGTTEVFAVPGSIFLPLSSGPRALLREGAKLVETAADIFEEFGVAVPRSGEKPYRQRLQHNANRCLSILIMFLPPLTILSNATD